MKKDLTELVFIVDRSGSMSGLETDTIGGFNATLKAHKKQMVKQLSQLCCSITRLKSYMTECQLKTFP